MEQNGIKTGDIMGLTTTDLIEAMVKLHGENKLVYVDVGDKILRLVETIRRDVVNEQDVVVLRALY